jgi:hypothetical protein
MRLNWFGKMNRRNANDSLETSTEMQFLSVDLFKPDKTMIATVLPACAQLGDRYLRKKNI